LNQWNHFNPSNSTRLCFRFSLTSLFFWKLLQVRPLRVPNRKSPTTNQHPFLQAGCRSCCPTNSVRALKENLYQHTAYTNLKLSFRGQIFMKCLYISCVYLHVALNLSFVFKKDDSGSRVKSQIPCQSFTSWHRRVVQAPFTDMSE